MLKDPTSPERWQKPGVADEAAGDWEGGAAREIAVIVARLNELFAEDRMPLSEVLERLEAAAAAAGVDGSEAAGSSSRPVGQREDDQVGHPRSRYFTSRGLVGWKGRYFYRQP